MEHLEGKVSILAALQARRRRFQVILVKYGSREESYREVLAAAEQVGVPVKTVAEDELTRMSHGSTHGGIIAVCSPLPRMTPAELLQLVDQRGGLAAHRASATAGNTETDRDAGFVDGFVDDRGAHHDAHHGAHHDADHDADHDTDHDTDHGAHLDAVAADGRANASSADEVEAGVAAGEVGDIRFTIDGGDPMATTPAPAATGAEPPLLLLIEGVDDARNLGFVLRTADAMGVHAVLIKKHLWDFDPVEVARPSSGAYERLPLVQFEGVDLLNDLKRRGLKLYGCIAGGKRTIHDLDLKEPAILAIGGEKRGLSGAVRDVCNRFARIPTVGGPTSLSMSHAAAIVLAEARRQRGLRG